MGLSNAKDGQPLNNEQNNKDAETNDQPDSFLECSMPTMTIHVFFDGTGNNMFNTEHRLEDIKAAKEAKEALPANTSNREKIIAARDAKSFGHLKGQISYDNDYSNVALLYKAAEDDRVAIRRIYVEGAGTIRDQEDDRGGLAAATGPSGIMARVYNAFEQINEILIQTMEKPSDLVFNVFGFSRGSFYARYFCALLKQTIEQADQAAKKPLQDPKIVDKQNQVIGSGGVPLFTNDYDFKSNGRALLDYKPEDITINLVGIYDTVASHGWNHHNDSVDFMLDIGAKQSIHKVIHITAINEYRNHFALVETNTAQTQKNGQDHPIGFKCAMPGAHADIGGGYIKNYPELDLYLSNYKADANLRGESRELGEIHWQWFVNQGYYTTDYAKYTQIRHQRARLAEVTSSAEKDKLAKSQEISQFQETIKKLPADDGVAMQAGDYGELRFVNATFRNEVRATRRVVGNAYQYVPLEVMYQLATHEALRALKFSNLAGLKTLQNYFKEVSLDPILASYRDYAVKQTTASYITETDLILSLKNAGLSLAESQYIYHEYIHNSLQVEFKATSDGFGNYLTNGSQDYNKDSAGNPIRVVVFDNAKGVQNKQRPRTT